MERARQAPAAGAAGGAGGTLTLAAVPIGRPQDASPQLAAALGAAPVVAAEDTGRLRRLASALGVQVTGRVVSYWDEVEAERVPGLLAELTAGQDVLLVTDAGMPGISDPGYRLVAAAAKAGIRVSVLPGPSAVTSR
jgi:16S rRNA (cytidine1402-2'-O)-methyltransferase